MRRLRVCFGHGWWSICISCSYLEQADRFHADRGVGAHVRRLLASGDDAAGATLLLFHLAPQERHGAASPIWRSLNRYCPRERLARFGGVTWLLGGRVCALHRLSCGLESACLFQLRRPTWALVRATVAGRCSQPACSRQDNAQLSRRCLAKRRESGISPVAIPATRCLSSMCIASMHRRAAPKVPTRVCS